MQGAQAPRASPVPGELVASKETRATEEQKAFKAFAATPVCGVLKASLGLQVIASFIFKALAALDKSCC